MRESIRPWADNIKDDNLHHIGEYYTFRYGKPWQKKNREGITKSFYNWFIRQNHNAFYEQIFKGKFEVLRDRDCTYSIKRKRT